MLQIATPELQTLTQISHSSSLILITAPKVSEVCTSTPAVTTLPRPVAVSDGSS